MTGWETPQEVYAIDHWQQYAELAPGPSWWRTALRSLCEWATTAVLLAIMVGCFAFAAFRLLRLLVRS